MEVNDAYGPLFYTILEALALILSQMSLINPSRVGFKQSIKEYLMKSAI